MYRTLAVYGYRSLRDVVIPLGRITVVTGGNGCGKSNLYKALRLLSACGQDNVVRALAAEGGLSSVLWAGPESLSAVRRGESLAPTIRRAPISLRVGIAGDHLGYLIDLGLPQPQRSAFERDPEIKREALWFGPVMRPSTLVARRKHEHTEVKADRWMPAERVSPHMSLLSGRDIAEQRDMRDELAAWRFYDSFRTDFGAPARRPQVGTRTWALADDGADLAAALVTILEEGHSPVLELVEDAFPGSTLHIQANDGVFSLELQQPGMLRPLSAAELSDGTLRYLMLLAALHAARSAPLLTVNEPENSLHPSLIPALARMIVAASERAQIVLITHSEQLIHQLADAAADVEHVRLRKDEGETVVSGQGLLNRPAWEWGRR